jgi:N-acyl-phosphatidylethanolamine-hydrolysing phospholipase D
MEERPPHHAPDGRFRTPWPLQVPDGSRGAGFLRWQWERLRARLPPDPPPGAIPRVRPRVAHPRAGAGELRITWIGQAGFLLQLGGLNLLLDPHFGERASPFRRIGPRRLSAPGLTVDGLPPVDAVLLSHDHYDHLDDASVRALHARFGGALTWIAPLGHAAWLRARGIRSAVDVDWGDVLERRTPDGRVEIACAPAQHWSRRGAGRPNGRLWASFAVRAEGGAAVYFGGDSGYFPGYREIGRRLGPFDAVLMPIGAYEPRWFMAAAHMTPAEAVRAYLDLGGAGVLVPMHWGTFRLTDEDPLEPPVRVRVAWEAAGLPAERLRVAGIGETVIPGE